MSGPHDALDAALNDAREKIWFVPAVQKRIADLERELQEARDELKRALWHRDQWRDRANTVEAIERGEVWYWQGDGEDHPESLTCPVIMKAHALREFLTARDERDALCRHVEALREACARKDRERAALRDG